MVNDARPSTQPEALASHCFLFIVMQANWQIARLNFVPRSHRELFDIICTWPR
jgi:hypothetical protein